jgi:hypothetical protein
MSITDIGTTTGSTSATAAKNAVSTTVNGSKPVSRFDSNSSGMYDRIVTLVNQRRYDEALSKLKNHQDPVAENLRAVVFMRTDRVQDAISTLRRLTINSISLEFKPDIPLHFKTNFATALLLAGHVAGCQQMLHQISPPSERVKQLWQNMRRWEKSLSFWKWVDWRFFRIEHIRDQVPIDFEPGDMTEF